MINHIVPPVMSSLFGIRENNYNYTSEKFGTFNDWNIKNDKSYCSSSNVIFIWNTWKQL